ncbi:MAG: gliding motility-associated C-terminal domain-containing protein [Bacteroidetes bacterium]|nr:gliding motility-associated C-terminal domain-containing protein [Bacteroidota bacterium]
MKKACTLLLILFTQIAYSQNLVVNPGFEDYNQCPFTYGELYQCVGWFQTTSGSSDYLNTCMVTLAPANLWGYRWPRTGNGYAGFYTYANYNLNYREYISGQLSQPLAAGQLYCFGFYLSLADSSNVSTSHIGIYFSNTSPLLLTDSLGNLMESNLPHIPQYEELQAVTNRPGWFFVTGAFIASGGEAYLTIGNFRDSVNSVLDTSGSPLSWPSQYISYYYIDDVFVEACLTPPYKGSFVNVPNVFTPNGDGVNDLFVVESQQIKTFELTIYNRWGNKVFSSQSATTHWDGLDESGKDCMDGNYYYTISAEGNDNQVYRVSGYLMLIH